MQSFGVCHLYPIHGGRHKIDQSACVLLFTKRDYRCCYAAITERKGFDKARSARVRVSTVWPTKTMSTSPIGIGTYKFFQNYVKYRKEMEVDVAIRTSTLVERCGWTGMVASKMLSIARDCKLTHHPGTICTDPTESSW
jgi:hypothetical protein